MAQVIDELIIELGFRGQSAINGLTLVNNGLITINRNASTATTNFNEMESAIGKVRNQVLLLLSAFTAGKGIKSFADDTIKQASSLKFLSENLGIATQDLQAWNMAAQQMGASGDAMTNMFAKAASESAKFRANQFQDTFALRQGAYSYIGLGGSTSGLIGASPEEILKQKSNALQRAFQKGGVGAGLEAARMLDIDPEAINLMKQGYEAMMKIVDAQQRYAIITKEDAEAALKLDQQLQNLGRNYQNIGTRIILDLIPATGGGIKVFDQLADTIHAHQGEINETIEGWTERFLKFIKPFIDDPKKLETTLTNWAERADNFADKIIRIVDAIDALVGAINGLVSFGTAGTGSFFPTKQEFNEYLGASQEMFGYIPPPSLSGILGATSSLYPKFKPESGFLTDKLREAAKKHGFSYEEALSAYVSTGGKYDIEPMLLMAQGYQESGFNPNAKNKIGAAGIAQFMPKTAKQYGINPLNMMQSIDAQGRFMAHNRELFGDNFDVMLAGYNAGEDAVKKYNGKVPPYPETRKYIDSVRYAAHIPKGETDITTHIGTINIIPKSDVTFGSIIKSVIGQTTAGQMQSSMR